MTDKIKIPLKDKNNSSVDNNIEELKSIINNLISNVDDIKKLINISDKDGREDFDKKFNGLLNLLNDSVNSYFESNQELLNKFQTIEHNTLFILSDGEDNSSRKYKKNDVDQMCAYLESQGCWNIIYCNTDTSNLTIQNKITYDVDNIEYLFQNLAI